MLIKCWDLFREKIFVVYLPLDHYFDVDDILSARFISFYVISLRRSATYRARWFRSLFFISFSI